ncbi:C40 family peptidase [Streptacidiphilus sp. PAMC 29251]
MGQHSAVAALSRTAVTVAAATAAVLAGGGSALAEPTPGARTAPATADEVRQQVQSLYAQAEVAGQQYDGAREQQRALLRTSALLQQRVAAEQQRINTMVGTMGQVAGAQYRQGGGIDPLVRLLLDAHPDQFLAQAGSVDELDAATAQRLQLLQDDQRQLGQDRAQAVSQLAQLEALRQSIAGSKAQVQRQLSHARALLAGLSAPQRTALRHSEAAVADAAAQAAAQAADTVLPPDQGPASSRAAIALAAARSALGRPYVYGATGPDAFDCSGLMYWSWQHAGVHLPRTSQGQMYAGRQIPLSQARPGDLVIYYSDRHHVGMYAGNGMVIHAPYPGARVRYEPVNTMPVAGVVRI